MVDLNSTILLITVNENCLNTSIKKHSVYKEISLNIKAQMAYIFNKIKVLKVNIAFDHKLKEN